MKPPFIYYGGKGSIAEQIVAMFPSHIHYVEPFAGSLAVLLAKPQAKLETVNDLDHELVTFWRILRDRTQDLIAAADLTPHARAEHAGSFDPTDDELEIARRVWVRLSQGRTGTLKRTGWRHHEDPRGTSISVPAYLDGYRIRLGPAARRLMSVSLECRPALEVIATYGKFPDTLLYVDPPYVGTTRGGTNYRHEMPHEAEHRNLAAALRNCDATVVLSGYASPLYRELYGDWHQTSIATCTTQGPSRKARTEVLWSNRPIGAQPALFDMTGGAA